MPPKVRNRENKTLPKGWRYRRGLYLYRVPVAERYLWDDKSEFRLGKSLAEAHRTFSERIAKAEAPKSAEYGFPTMAHLIDHYERVVTPTKAPATQRPEKQMLGKLRAIWGDMVPAAVTPVKINKVKHATAEKISATTANHHLRVLSHVFTMGIEWGVIASHPMTGKKVTRVKHPRKQHHIPTDEDIAKSLTIAPDVIEAYVQIKIRTGLRQTDMLKLKRADIKEDGLHVTPSKTADTTGKSMIFELSPDLRHWLHRACCANRQRVQSMWIFQTRDGKPYIDDADDASSFHSAWQRWQKKVKAMGVTRYAERYLRNKVGDDSASDEDARERLNHGSIATTRKHYRTKPTKVSPIRRD